MGWEWVFGTWTPVDHNLVQQWARVPSLAHWKMLGVFAEAKLRYQLEKQVDICFPDGGQGAQKG